LVYLKALDIRIISKSSSDEDDPFDSLPSPYKSNNTRSGTKNQINRGESTLPKNNKGTDILK
jgi:hypothetical protein